MESALYTHPITATLSWCRMWLNAGTVRVTYMEDPLTNPATGGRETFDQGEGIAGQPSTQCHNETGYVIGGYTLGITYSGGTPLRKTFYLSIAIDGIPDAGNERRELIRNTVDWLVA